LAILKKVFGCIVVDADDLMFWNNLKMSSSKSATQKPSNEKALPITFENKLTLIL